LFHSRLIFYFANKTLEKSDAIHSHQVIAGLRKPSNFFTLRPPRECTGESDLRCELSVNQKIVVRKSDFT
jgi:hypothetical protein